LFDQPRAVRLGDSPFLQAAIQNKGLFMNSDHHYVIGHSHEVCQDYAKSNGDVAALSDGCSIVVGKDGKQVAADTDTGARLLVAAVLQQAKFGFRSILQAAEMASGIATLIGIGTNSITATLATISKNDNGTRAEICGDGLIAGRSRDGSGWAVFQYQFPTKPFYPRYMLDHGRDAQRFFSECGDKFNLRMRPVGGAYENSTLPLLSNAPGDGFNFTHEFDLVVAMSDGIFSFTHKSKLVDTDAIIDRFLDFRRLKGRFVLRQLNGVLRELKEEGYENQDDVSMIAIHAD
jgi:hypothetical protein